MSSVRDDRRKEGERNTRVCTKKKPEKKQPYRRRIARSLRHTLSLSLFLYSDGIPVRVCVCSFCRRRRRRRRRTVVRVGGLRGGRGWRRSRTAGAAHRETARGHRAQGRLRAVHVPVARLSQARAPVQRPVQAAHTHAGAFGREAQQMHGEYGASNAETGCANTSGARSERTVFEVRSPRTGGRGKPRPAGGGKFRPRRSPLRRGGFRTNPKKSSYDFHPIHLGLAEIARSSGALSLSD